MPLDDSFKLRANDAGGYFAKALRVIGQDLAELFPERVEIYFQDGGFEVRVRCDRKRAEKKQPATEKPGLKGVFHKLATYRLDKPPEGADIVIFEHRYGTDEIGRLDRAALQHRSQVGKIPDINSLGEALRMIGRIVDAEGGQLLRIIKDQRAVTFDYTNNKGATQKIEMTRSELFKMQQSYYSKRSGGQSIDLWRGSN